MAVVVVVDLRKRHFLFDFLLPPSSDIVVVVGSLAAQPVHLGQFALKVLGRESDIGEQSPEHVHLLGERFDALLKSVVLALQLLHLVFGLLGTELGLLATLADGDVVPFATTSILVATLVHQLLGLVMVVVMMMTAQDLERLAAVAATAGVDVTTIGRRDEATGSTRCRTAVGRRSVTADTTTAAQR